MSDAPAQPSPSLHGPGGLLGTPGLGTPARRKRKWGLKLKAKQIVGNLYRSDTGKFQAGSGGSAAGASPARGRQLSRQPKPTARPVAKPVKAAPKKAAPKGSAGPKPKDPAIAARQAQRDQEHQADRAQRATDREARLARQAQRDQEHQADRAQRQADRAKKQPPAGPAGALAAIDAKLTKPAKPAAAAGGGGKKPAEKPDKAAERAKKATETASQVGMAAPDLAALRSATETGGVQNDALSKLGLVGPDGLATDQGRRALTALERGDVRQYNAALQDASARMGREQGARDRKQAAEGRRSAAEQLRDTKRSQQIDRIKRRAMSGGKLTQSQMDQAIEAGALDTNGRWKSFTVFKDHQGQRRWIARTTTAYRDRDAEILSAAALDADSQRMTATKQFGPLRYWHVGQPDPFDAQAPWGPGLDIGDCDYSVQIGPTRIESGTFRDSAIAQTIAQKSGQYELSPGFFYPPDQPDSAKVFTTLRTFERSVVPTRYSRASNLFTGLAVKESRMDVMSLDEMERRFKAAVSDLGLDKDQALALGQQLVATVKNATEQRIAYKEAEPPAAAAAPPATIYYGPDNQPGIIQEGAWIALKAFPPKVADELVSDTPEVEAKADDPDDPMDAIVEDVVEPEEEPSYDSMGDMTRDEFRTFMSELLAPALKLQDMVKSIGDAHAELKGMYGGAATKEAGVNAELASLKSQQTALAAKIAQIEGNQPATILPDDVAAALKSTGPEQPADPDAVDIPNDPSRPFAQIAARTMPALYKNTPDGGFAGWAPPPTP
jgi:hypothetical protein